MCVQHRGELFGPNYHRGSICAPTVWWCTISVWFKRKMLLLLLSDRHRWNSSKKSKTRILTRVLSFFSLLLSSLSSSRMGPAGHPLRTHTLTNTYWDIRRTGNRKKLDTINANLPHSLRRALLNPFLREKEICSIFLLAHAWLVV